MRVSLCSTEEAANNINEGDLSILLRQEKQSTIWELLAIEELHLQEEDFYRSASIQNHSSSFYFADPEDLCNKDFIFR
jgi:hypothetical protein